MRRIFFLLLIPFLLSAEANSANHFIFGTSAETRVSGADDIIVRKELFPDLRIAGYVNGTLVLNLAMSQCNSSTILYVSGLSGNDDISVSLPANCPIKCFVYGHAGYDYLNVMGCDGGAEVYGGDGDDKLYLGTENHYFNGEANGDNGADHFYYYLDGGVLHGGAGDDHFGWNEDLNENEYVGYVKQGYIYGDEGDDQFYGGPYEGGTVSRGNYFGGVGNDRWGNGCYRYIYCDSLDYNSSDGEDAFPFYELRGGCSQSGMGTYNGLDSSIYCDGGGLSIPDDPFGAPPSP